ncbi:cell division topological specificity factor MinE [Bauldia sp.]|uniref:cell division topological specificity factor MinE n=1 Tax=Bauldia sp. TaxID=2575872 RepID=UPI003BADB2A8
MLLRFLKLRRSAPVARDRLKILLAHERAMTGRPDLVAALREEILEVIRRHVPIDPDKVNVRTDQSGAVSTLNVDIELSFDTPRAAAA